jgi:hypothetical protein
LRSPPRFLDAPQSPLAGADPADPSAMATPLGPASTIGSYIRQAPGAPKTEAGR